MNISSTRSPIAVELKFELIYSKRSNFRFLAHDERGQAQGLPLRRPFKGRFDLKPNRLKLTDS